MVLGLSVVSVNLLEMGQRRALTHISGEIDIMEARGNGPTYPAQYAELPITSVPRFLTGDRLFAEASTTFEDR